MLTHMTFKSALNGQGFEMGTYRARSDGSAELADINKQIEKSFSGWGHRTWPITPLSWMDAGCACWTMPPQAICFP